jgi:hypothetical protein
LCKEGKRKGTGKEGERKRGEEDERKGKGRKAIREEERMRGRGNFRRVLGQTNSLCRNSRPRTRKRHWRFGVFGLRDVNGYESSDLTFDQQNYNEKRA